MKDKLFLKPFGYKVMTIFMTHSPFQKMFDNKQIHGNTTHLVRRLMLLKHCLKSSIIEVVAATTSSTGSKLSAIRVIFWLTLF